MDKHTLLTELSHMVARGEVSRGEVLAALAGEEDADTKPHRRFSVTKILYVIGGVIVMLGIGFFIGGVWDVLGSAGRIAVTLGLGVLLAISGSLLLAARPGNRIGDIFHALGGLIIPGGAVVFLEEAAALTVSPWLLTGVFAVLFVLYLALAFAHKREVLTFFALAHGTAALYFLTGALLEDSTLTTTEDIFAYLTMVIGIVYLLLARAVTDTWNKRLVPMFYFLGTAGFLGGAFSQVFDSGVWQALFFLFALGGVVVSVYLQSRGVLAVSTLFLIAHTVYITGEYFANSVGWPISLIILGFVIIGLGFGSVTISKKFIARRIK